MNNDTKGYVEKLIQEKGIVEVNEEILEQMKLDLESRIESLINARILVSLPEDALEEFEKKLDNSNDDDLQKFCNDKINNLDEVIATALLDFRKIYLR